jgi:hypothetical protein
LPEAQARAEAVEYAGFSGILLQRHPNGAPLDINEVLSLWRQADGETLEIASTGSVSDQAFSVSQTLSAPKVKLFDGRALAARYEKSGLPLKAAPASKKRFTLRIPRKRAKHCAVYGLAMLGMYVVTGLWTYLAGSLILLALTFLALRRFAPAPE